MHIQARRIFRLSSVLALSLAVAYALGLPLPFLAPLFALILTAAPAPPMAGKKLLELIVVILITLGVGLAIIPLIQHYPLVAVLVVALGLYFSFYLTVNQNKTMLGTFLTLGLTMISAAGSLSFALALTVIISLVIGIVVAVACNWLIYPLFPEDAVPAEMPNTSAEQSNWIALRGMLIVLPVYLLVLTNPLAYLAITMKSVALAQQSSVMDAKTAARELLGSTFLGGMFAILFWMLLGISTNLWMYGLWMLLFGIYFSSKIYQLLSSRYPASFWINVVMTLLIVLGPAVEDSAGGKDVYAAFWGRMGLYVAVTLYAWAAVYLLEHLRTRRRELPIPATKLETAL